MSETFLNYMNERLARTRAYQMSRGKRFDLSIDEYLALHSCRQLSTLEQHFEAGTLGQFLRCKWGYVLTWRSKAAFDEGLLCAETALITTREESRRRTFLKKGARHSEAARAKIGASRRTKKQSSDHIEKRAAQQRGVKRGPMTEEHKAAIRAGRARQLAAKRAAFTITPAEAAKIIMDRVRAMRHIGAPRRFGHEFRALDVQNTPISAALVGELFSTDRGGRSVPPPLMS